MKSSDVKERYKRKSSNSSLIKRFLPYYKPYTWLMILDLFCALLTTVCDLYLPTVVQQITNEGIKNPQAMAVSWILKIGGVYLLMRLVDTAANFFMASIGHITGTKMETDMRRDLFAHLQKLSFSYYDETKIGQLMSRITNDLFDVTEFAHHCPEEFFIAGVKIIGAFIILCFVNVPLTCIIFAVVPLILVTTRFFNKRMRAAHAESRVKVGELNSQVEDSLLGVRVVRSFANEDIEEEKFKKGNEAFLKVKSKAYYYMGGFNSCTRFFDGLMYILVVVVGALFVKYGKIDAAELVMYLLYVNTLLTSIRRIVEFTEQFQRGLTGIERFTEILDTPVTIADTPNARELTEVKGEIEFKNVGFRYSDNNEYVLSDINIKVTRGENVALVGPSGGGKTTLCSLIPRFYEVTDGSITLDGVDIKDLTLHSLRSNIGVVQQDVYLFSGSVLDNIEYGKPGADREEIIEAAKKAGAHEFIMKLPNGYDTYVGERGVKLSGGQKQRISIARVFLKDPPVLILDEATSALDNESEKLVQKSLEELAVGRTTFTVAHRLTTIRNATEILVLTERGIEEQGTHAELMEKGGIYSELYSMYTE